jgi:hypothetical protein
LRFESFDRLFRTLCFLAELLFHRLLNFAFGSLALARQFCLGRATSGSQRLPPFAAIRTTAPAATTAAAAATATAVTAAATAAAATTTATAEATAAARAGGTLSCLVYAHGAPIQILTVQSLSSTLSVCLLLEGNEAEPARTTGVTIHDNRCFDYRAESLERLSKGLIVRAKVEATNKQFHNYTSFDLRRPDIRRTFPWI